MRCIDCCNGVQMKPEQERVKTVLTDTVALLCKSGLSYKHELKVEAVIGVTVDETDVFIVHINESFNPQGATSTSSSANAAEPSMAITPFSQHAKREFEAPRTPTSRTPSSGVKRLRAESLPLSPSTDMARQHARHQLRFASPAKSPAGSMPGPGLLARGAVSSVAHVGGPRRGSGSARGGVRAARRGLAGRGLVTPRGLGMSQMTGRPRARGRGLPRHPLPGQRLPGDRSSCDVKFSPGNQSSFAAETSQSHMMPSAAAVDSSVGFNFSAYPHVLTTSPFTAAAAAGDGRHNAGADVPPFSASEHDGFVNTVPPGFGFDGVFPTNSSSSVQPGSFADINPSLEFGFLSGFNSSTSAGSGFATSSAQNVSGSDRKTESLDDDVIFVEDDAVDPVAADGGDGADGAVTGAAVQQITRRVTITTNIQGQNVKYEQVRLPFFLSFFFLFFF